jgi:hypothetical protein
MIQFFALIPKKKGISSQEFHDHWRHPHGTMGRQIPTLRSYVQCHQIETSLLDSGQHIFEGIAESTFDTVKDAMTFGVEPVYKTYIQPDEPNFVDGPGLQWLNTEEEVLVPRVSKEEGAAHADSLWLHLDLPLSIKILQFIRPDGNTSWAGNSDAELGHKIGALRHVRNYPMKAIHGDNPSYLGVRQLWWPTLSAFESGVKQNPEAFKQLLSQAGSSITLLAQAERLLR